MEINIESSKQFEGLLNALSREIVDAEVYFKLRKDLLAAIPDYKKVFNESNTFWSLTVRALLVSTLSNLCRVYDQHAKSLNLVNFLDTIISNISIFDTHNFKERLKGNPFVDSLSQESRKPDVDVLNQHLASVNEKDLLVKKLVIWRNNIIAHRTASNVLDEINIAQDYPITTDDISELLDRAISILNKYSNLFRASTYLTQIVGHDDYLYVLKSVGEKINKDTINNY